MSLERERERGREREFKPLGLVGCGRKSHCRWRQWRDL